MLAIGLSFWVQYARTVRSVTLVERNKEYVEAARLIGLRPFKIMFQHILPNVLGPVLVIATINLALAVITEATLSFLGVGLPPTEPSLGTMIQIGNRYLFSGSWWMVAFPGPDAGAAGAGGQSAGRLAARCAQSQAALVSVKHCNDGGPHVFANDPQDCDLSCRSRDARRRRRRARHQVGALGRCPHPRPARAERGTDAQPAAPALRAADPARAHRQAAADARRLVADQGRRSDGVGVQAAPGREVPQRQRLQRRRRGVLARARPAADLRHEGPAHLHRQGEQGRRLHGPDQDQGAKSAAAQLPDQPLHDGQGVGRGQQHDHRPGLQGEEGQLRRPQRQRHRALRAGLARAGREDGAQAQ